MKFCIGFALHSKKAQRYLTDRVLSLAEEVGLHIYEIDTAAPLEAQGPFHLIVHKCNAGKEWESELMEYSAAHPEVMVVDPVNHVNILRDRVTMLSLIPSTRSGSVYSLDEMRVFVPHQIEIREDAELEEVERRLEECEMSYPLLMKPKWADGRAGSHMLGFIGSSKGMAKALNPQINTMKPPSIAQQVIPHNGVIYKVYVIGECVICSVRPSLVMSKCVESFQLLPRISSKAANDDMPRHPLPPEELTTSLACLLRQELHLQLFNFDLIKDSRNENEYYIVDINYFPGIDKIENFEEIFVQFLLNSVKFNVYR